MIQSTDCKLVIAVLYDTVNRRFFTVQNELKAFTTPFGMTLADFVVQQALQVTPMPRLDTGRPDYAYRAVPTNQPIICFHLAYDGSHLPSDTWGLTDVRWRCYDTGILGWNSTHSSNWYNHDTLEEYIRTRIVAAEQELILTILQRESV